MTGKLALLMVGGLAITTMALNSAMNSNATVDALVRDLNKSNAHSIALSGANLASNTLYFNKNYRGVLRNNIDLNGGKSTVTVQSVGSKIQVTSQGVYPASGGGQETQQVVYYLSQAYLDRFVLLTDDDPGSMAWTSNDTAYGNLHSNNTLKMDHYFGSPTMPVFTGKVTATKPFIITSGTKPVFSQIPETGLSVKFASTFDPVTEAPFMPGGVDWNTTYTITSGPVVSHKQLHLQFFVESGVQKIRYFRHQVRTTNEGYGDFRLTDTVVAAPTSGIIYAPGVDVFVEGTITGKLSVLTVPDGSGSGGNIFVTNDLLCATNPRLYADSPDFVGLLAHNNVIIANTENDNATNSGSNRFRIQASMVALTGGLAAADNATRRRQVLEIYGSIAQKYRKGVGSGTLPVGSSWGGFVKGYYYDSRLLNNHALLMPASFLLATESWLERGANN
jgi:hypothetical protein